MLNIVNTTCATPHALTTGTDNRFHPFSVNKHKMIASLFYFYINFVSNFPEGGTATGKINWGRIYFKKVSNINITNN